jgi:hypothetical protein
VTELLKPFTSARAFVNAVSSWGGPLAVALGAYVMFVFGTINRTALVRDGARTLHHEGIEPWWVLIGLWLILTFALSAGSRWIYQVLEGILWPSAIKKRREHTHSLQWAVLDAGRSVEQGESRLDFANQELAARRDEMESAANDQQRAAAENKITICIAERDSAEQELKGARQALTNAQAARDSRPLGRIRRKRPPLFVLKEINAYPARQQWIRATRLGNRIRAFETDGVARYQLDPLELWYELLVTAPGSLAANIQAARQSVEIWVGTWSAAVLLAMASVATGVIAAIDPEGGSLIVPLVVAAVACGASVVGYRAATVATDEWGYAINALVKLGRGPLARAYGLKIPATIAEEKLMWEALRGYELYGTDAYASRLNEYRIMPDPDIATEED